MEIILAGYYGFRNVGDEQLLDETIRLLNEYYPNGNITVASGPKPLPFQTFNRWNPLSWVNQLIKSNVLIFGGGSIFQSQTSIWSLLYYLCIIQLARFFDTNIILLCQGWGPFKSKWHESLTKKILSKPTIYRTWRDKKAKQSFGNDNDTVYCDLALLQKRKGELFSLQEQTPVIGVSIRNQSLINILNNLAENYNKNTLTLINQPTKVCNNNELLLEDFWDNPKNTPINFVITDRYHTAIWASKFGIPWVAISTDPKLTQLASDANQIALNQNNHEWQSKLDDLIHHSTPTPNQSLIDWYDAHKEKRSEIGNWLHENISR